MYRRDLLKFGLAGLASLTPSFRQLRGADSMPFQEQQGWWDIPEARDIYIENTAQPYFESYQALKGDGKNKQVMLWKPYEKVTGKKFNTRVQDIGDCVGQGSTLAAEVLSTVEIVNGDREEYRGEFSTEVTYIGSRVEIGKGKIRRGDGSTGAWAAQFLTDFGVVLRAKYPNFDVSVYDPELARRLAKPGPGLPPEIEAIAKEHSVQTSAMVRDWDSACDSVANGYPVFICSNVGFNNTRDRQGFLRRRGAWYHCMLLWGIDTVSSREGGCIQNSWNKNWVNGPEHELGTPEGGFWADADVIDAMLRQKDSYAVSGFKGFPSRKLNLDYSLI